MDILSESKHFPIWILVQEMNKILASYIIVIDYTEAKLHHTWEQGTPCLDSRSYLQFVCLWQLLIWADHTFESVALRYRDIISWQLCCLSMPLFIWCLGPNSIWLEISVSFYHLNLPGKALNAVFAICCIITMSCKISKFYE